MNDTVKLELLTAELRLGSVLVRVDGRACTGLPEQFASDMLVTLRIGYGLNPPIPDLTLDSRGWRGTLAFGGRSWFVDVPWSAMFSFDGQATAVAWHDSMPRADVVPKRPRATGLRLVD